MKSLDNKKRAQVVAALVEGNSIRATVRMTGVAKNTIVKLLENLGMACAEYQDKAFRNLACKQIQCDEIWSFVGSKAKNVSPDKEGIFGEDHHAHQDEGEDGVDVQNSVDQVAHTYL